MGFVTVYRDLTVLLVISDHIRFQSEHSDPTENLNL